MLSAVHYVQIVLGAVPGVAAAIAIAYPTYMTPCVLAGAVAGVLLGQISLMSPAVSSTTNAAAVNAAKAAP